MRWSTTRPPPVPSERQPVDHSGQVKLSSADATRLRGSVNQWISVAFPKHRRHLRHSRPRHCAKQDAWEVELSFKGADKKAVPMGKLLVHDGRIDCDAEAILAALDKLPKGVGDAISGEAASRVEGPDYLFELGDGIQGAAELRDGQVDLLLTDPPYGISKPYTCESQVPRRLRSDGRDFTMPKGHFGDWDEALEPDDWLAPMLPKVKGWIVTFCAQEQIGAYMKCLADRKLVAVGALVWQKTNPVPFNHKFKPINAWEAAVCGKRPGAAFNGDGVVHNVFKCRSPSPQERIHPTQKPLDLMRRFVRLFSNKDGFVFDPFAGSATTIVAAHLEGRQSLGYEADHRIVDEACTRIVNMHALKK